MLDTNARAGAAGDDLRAIKQKAARAGCRHADAIGAATDRPGAEDPAIAVNNGLKHALIRSSDDTAEVINLVGAGGGGDLTHADAGSHNQTIVGNDIGARGLSAPYVFDGAVQTLDRGRVGCGAQAFLLRGEFLGQNHGGV